MKIKIPNIDIIFDNDVEKTDPLICSIRHKIKESGQLELKDSKWKLLKQKKQLKITLLYSL